MRREKGLSRFDCPENTNHFVVVSLYDLVWLVMKQQRYYKQRTAYFLVLQNPVQSNWRPAVQWYVALQSKWAFSVMADPCFQTFGLTSRRRLAWKCCRPSKSLKRFKRNLNYFWFGDSWMFGTNNNEASSDDGIKLLYVKICDAFLSITI